MSTALEDEKDMCCSHQPGAGACLHETSNARAGGSGQHLDFFDTVALSLEKVGGMEWRGRE